MPDADVGLGIEHRRAMSSFILQQDDRVKIEGVSGMDARFNRRAITGEPRRLPDADCRCCFRSKWYRKDAHA